jgi:hypothetical protein
METKLNGEENTVVTRLKPDITAYRCRRKKDYAANYETQHKGILDYISNTGRSQSPCAPDDYSTSSGTQTF